MAHSKSKLTPAQKKKNAAIAKEHRALFSKRIENEKSNIYRQCGLDKAKTLLFLEEHIADEKKSAAVKIARQTAREWASPMPY